MQRITQLEKDYVLMVLDSQFRTSAGAGMAKRLETAFAAKFNSKFAISCANGTVTLHSALVAAGIGPGDEVIVPPLTMAASAFAPILTGALPIFADVDPKTWTLDPACVAKLISPRTKAIIPVSLYGLAPDMDPIMELARKHKLFVLEDDAQCFLGYYKDRVVGSIGHASSFSFQASKHITSGEGGMVTTNDEELAAKIRRFGSLGYAAVGAAAGQSKISRKVIQDPKYLRHSAVGSNYRLSEVCAAIALGQVERLEELVQVRIDAVNAFREVIKGCSWLVPQFTPAHCKHACWTFVCALEMNDPLAWYKFRDKYVELGGDGIYGCWELTYLEPALRRVTLMESQKQVFDTGLCPIAESLQPKLLQFKTDYFDLDRRGRAMDALAKCISHFSKR